ncbi:MAG: ADP-ribosylglycohydrolase family protein [Bacilli bacterium]|nr:ADP-ribosylglycohydrolase family protein [Bacilli bacterium]
MENTKVKDGMFGLAIADAVGVPAEFKSREELKINPITKMIGYGTHNQPEGTWSDDSSMAIATMDSINETGTIDYDDIMHKFFDWANNSKYTATGVFFDIGITTSNAIRSYTMGIDPIQCGEKSVRSNGNGSLMRILPVVLYCYYNNIPYEQEVELINNVSSLTHAHEISKLGCKIYADYMREILNGNNPEIAYENLKDYDYSKYYSQESIQYYKRLFDGSLKKAPEEEIRSSGFVVDTLEASIWCNLKSNNYEEAVLKAVNLGEDTDTVGAVTGSIAGVYYGYENIPEYWREHLKSKEYLDSLCTVFENKLGNNLTK